MPKGLGIIGLPTGPGGLNIWPGVAPRGLTA